MGWKQAIREERTVLKSIVARLLALADLAESACGRSLPVCALLLWILSPAETVVRALVAHSSDTSPEQAPSDSRESLRQLAKRFRQLARIVETEAERAFSCCLATGTRIGSGAGAARSLLRFAHAVDSLGILRGIPTPDTS